MEANEELGLPADSREYDVGAQVRCGNWASLPTVKVTFDGNMDHYNLEKTVVV